MKEKQGIQDPLLTGYANDLEALKRKQASIVEGIRIMVDDAKEQSRLLTTAEEEELRKAEAELPQLSSDIERVEKDMQQAAAQNFVRDAQASVDRHAQPRTLQYGDVARITNMRERVGMDPKRGFRSMADFSDAVYRAGYEQQVDERFLRYDAAMTFASGADGGFLMPPEFSQVVWNQMLMEPVNLMQLCDNYPISGESLTLLANGETSRKTGSRFGGIQGYWVEDGTQITDSNPKVRRVRLEPHPLHVMVKVDNTLLRNPLAVERLLNMAAPEEIVFLVNDAIINGNGAGKPLGIMNSSGRVVAQHDAAGVIAKGSIDKMWSRLHMRARRGAQWFINVDVDVQLEALVAAGTTPAIPIFLPSDGGIPSVAIAPNRTLKGRPITEIEQCQTVGTEGDIILADMMGYALGTRGTIETAMSMHLYFDRNQSAFRFTFYVDGQPWQNVPLTPFLGNNTVSYFVTLDTDRTA